MLLWVSQLQRNPTGAGEEKEKGERQKAKKIKNTREREPCVRAN